MEPPKRVLSVTWAGAWKIPDNVCTCSLTVTNLVTDNQFRVLKHVHITNSVSRLASDIWNERKLFKILCVNCLETESQQPLHSCETCRIQREIFLATLSIQFCATVSKYEEVSRSGHTWKRWLTFSKKRMQTSKS
jgi:hypothetical protein